MCVYCACMRVCTLRMYTRTPTYTHFVCGVHFSWWLGEATEASFLHSPLSNERFHAVSAEESEARTGRPVLRPRTECWRHYVPFHPVLLASGGPFVRWSQLLNSVAFWKDPWIESKFFAS